MKCPKCGKEFSEPVLPLHVARCEKGKKIEENKQKKIEQMTKAQIIEMIKEKETPQK